MAIRSPSTINASQGLDSVIPWISEVTNFWFGRMITLAIFVLFLMGYMRAKEDDFIGGLAVASFTTFVLGLIFWVIGLLTGLDFAIVIGVTFVSAVLLLTQKKEY